VENVIIHSDDFAKQFVVGSVTRTVRRMSVSSVGSIGDVGPARSITAL